MKVSNAMSRRGFLSTLAATALVSSTAPAFAGGDGGGDRKSVKPKSTVGSSKKTKKKSKFEIYAETVEDNYRTRGMGYYTSSKSRMRRLLERMHQERKAGQSHIRDTLDKIQFGIIGGRLDPKKHKPGLATDIINASSEYTKYRNKKSSKAKYSARMKFWIGFVP
ncbi:MAG: hypothetical protein AAFR49_11825 [Pseudomonadota bacterium]